MLIDIVSIHHLPYFMYKRKKYSRESFKFITSSSVCRMDVVFAITQEIIRGNHPAADEFDIVNRVD